MTCAAWGHGARARFARTGLVAVGLGLLAATPHSTARAETPTLQPRIANGVETAGWPEVGSLITNLGTCSATFVGCRSVVTAAHCVCEVGGTGAACGIGEQLVDPAQAVVFAPQVGLFAVDEIQIPSDYLFGVRSDIAMLRLGSEIRSVRPRHINEVRRPDFGTQATIVGLGRTQAGASDGGLKRAGAVSTTNCAGSGVPDSTHVCWNYLLPLGAPGTDSNTCSGDSGGPLLVDLGVGVALTGVHSGGNNDCNPDGSSFDTDVFVQRNWLRAQAGVDLDRASCGDGPSVGDPAVTSLAFSGTVFSQWLQNFQVPSGTKVLRVGLNGTAVGDLDLYLNPGSPATTTTFTCASGFAGSFEYCEVEDPTPGTWYALMNLRAGNPTAFQLAATMLPPDPAPPPLALGQILTSNFRSFELIQVEPADGGRVVASSPLRGSGPDLAGPEGLGVDRERRVLVANAFNRNLLRVDAESGDRTVVSGCADGPCTSTVGTGPAFLGPRFLAIEPDQRILVADRSLPGTYAVVRVEPSSGDRTVVSGCADSDCAQVVGAGPAIGRLFGIARDGAGTIYVVDGQALYQIDPVNGDRMLVSGCADSGCASSVGAGPVFGEPTDVAITAAGAIFVSYQIEGAVFGALRQIDPATGARALVSGCEDVGCNTVRGAGPRFGNPFGIGFGLDGSLLVADLSLDAVLRVDLVSGDRTLVSGCADLSCSSALGAGPGFGESIDVAVIPEPASAALATGAVAVLAVLARRRFAPADSCTGGNA